MCLFCLPFWYINIIEKEKVSFNMSLQGMKMMGFLVGVAAQLVRLGV